MGIDFQKYLWILVFFAVASCRRNSFDTDLRSLSGSKNPAAGIGVEAPDLFTSDRTTFQTRGVMVFKISESYWDRISELSLNNLTSGASIIDNQVVAAGLEEDEDWSLTAGGTEIIIKIYPSIAEIKSKLVYGPNAMRLVTKSPKEVLHKEMSVKFADFRYFAMTFSNPPSDPPASRPLSGGVTGVVNNMSSNGKSYLFTSAVHVLTH